MNKEEILVSVIIPCYNQATYLSETLESLLSQTYKLWEGIIVNDGSPDNTEEIALKYVENDKRFKYVYKENGGLSSARNKGIELANGEYILPLDSDDTIEPEYLRKAIDVFTKVPQTKLVYCLAVYFGTVEGNWDVSYMNYKKLLLGNSIFCSAFFRKEDWIKIGGYDEKMISGYEDWDFYIRLLDEESIVHQIPLVLFNYRKKEVSMVTHLEQKKHRDIVEDYLYNKHRDKYSYYWVNKIDVIREFEYYKRKVERYRKKWYRQWFKRVKNICNRYFSMF